MELDVTTDFNLMISELIDLSYLMFNDCKIIKKEHVYTIQTTSDMIISYEMYKVEQIINSYGYQLIGVSAENSHISIYFCRGC